MLKRISSDITYYLKIINKQCISTVNYMLLLYLLTTDSSIKCYNYEVFTEFVWSLNFHSEKNNSDFHKYILIYYHIMSINKYISQ